MLCESTAASPQGVLHTEVQQVDAADSSMGVAAFKAASQWKNFA